MEIVMAWFVGGLIGRWLGHTYLVSYLGWSEVCGWLSVPIGSAIAWLAVEVRAIVPALKHAYRWTTKPGFPKEVTKYVTTTKNIFVDDTKEFRREWNWRILRVVSCGLLLSSWFLLLVALVVASGNLICLPAAVFPVYMSIGVDKFFRYMYWEGETYDRPWRDGESEERREALEWTFCFLLFNPISAVLVCLLVACSYWLFTTLAEVVVWISCVLWKTIRMVNSSQRMVAMTGAIIGLSVSQIYGFNPAICGGVCVLAGLTERLIFTLFERAVLKFGAKQQV